MPKKMIKFTLPIGEFSVATLNDLQRYFNTDIVEHLISGKLAKWLRCRDMSRELAAVDELYANVLKELCRIFEVEVDNDTIAAAMKEATSTSDQRKAVPLREIRNRPKVDLT